MDQKLVWKRKGVPESWGSEPVLVSQKDIKRRQKACGIPAKFGINLSPKLQEAFENAVHYFCVKNASQKPPSIPELRGLMENLKNSAEAFARSLEDIEATEILSLINGDPAQISRIYEHIDIANFWRKAAAESLPKSSTGPKSNTTLSSFILEIADIFEQATGKVASPGYFDKEANEVRGDFAVFLAALLDLIEIGIYHSGRSLVETILPQTIQKR
ncbi:MAG: hypothetical protein WAW37_14185 [Syntrophobacteraceae bacterium]